MNNTNDFVIKNGVLKKYKGPGGDVVIPEGVTSIGYCAFEDCSSLTSVVIPEGVTSIGNWAFEDCRSLTSVVIPEGVTSIGERAFYGCSSLTSVVIPDSVTSIGYRAFSGCDRAVFHISNEAANRPEIFIINNGVLKDYKGPGGDVVIPEGVTSIGDWAFCGCSSLTSVVIPDGVTSIGSNAFDGCSSLTSVVIPEGVTSIGGGAFRGCKGLKDNDGFVIVQGVLYDYDGPGGDVVIPEGVTSIGYCAFDGCSSLTSVVIPDSVTSIGERAFDGCSSLTSVVIPEGVTSIGSNAFDGCSSLTSVVIPDGVTSIGDGAFCGCSSLTSVVIPDGVTSIGDGAFRGCSSLTSVVIPDGVTSIGDETFKDCSSLTSVVIPDGVTSIGENVFSGCSALQELIVPKKLKSLGEKPFGSQFPEALRTQIGTFYHALNGTSLKSYVLTSDVWDSLDDGLKVETFLTWQGKYLLQAYVECVKAQDMKHIGNAILERLQGEKPTSKECTAAVNYIILFYKDAPLELLRQLYDGLKKAKTGGKALKSVEENVALVEKLSSTDNADAPETEIERIIVENYTQRGAETKLERYYGLACSDLPMLCGLDGNTLKPFVLAWLLVAHETQRTEAAFEKPGLCPEAERIVAMLDQESFQAALMALADEHLVKYQNTKKKFLCFPICRYANETTMVELTKRAPKWSTSVSGNDAPPLFQMREAVRYSDTRAAMLFAERYHELDKYAALRGMTEDEMRDRYLSDVGLDEQGGKTYDLGNQTVTARLRQDLSYRVELPNGKSMKSLPKKGADTGKYSTAKADFDEMRKATKKILKSRGQVLFQDFLSGRERGAAEWQEVYLKNPLLRKAASLIVWAQGDKTFTLRDGSPIDSGEQPYTITDAPIRVAHPMEMTTNDTVAWQKYFNTHGLKQPFVQVWEPVIDPATIREDRYEGSVLTVYRFVNMDKHGIHSGSLHAYSEDIGFTLDGCSLNYEASTWRINPYEEQELTYKLGKFRFDQYTRKVNHIVSLLDKWTVKERVSKDDISVLNLMDGFTLAQITEFIAAAQEANAVNVLAALLEYKNNKFSDFDPMEEFTLEW